MSREVYAIVVTAIENKQLDWKVGSYVAIEHEDNYGPTIRSVLLQFADFYDDQKQLKHAIAACKEHVKGVTFDHTVFRQVEPLGKIDPEVDSKGTCVAILAGPSSVIEAIRCKLEEETKARVDWGYVGGRAPMKVLGTQRQIDQARSMIEGLVPQILMVY